MPKQITENVVTQKVTETLGATTKTGPGKIRATLITPGKGSSGTYTVEVLQQAAADKAFPRGTQMHINHNTAMDDMERPEGDLRNLAGVLLEDAYWDGNGLVAEARISSAWRDFIDEFGEFIGVSISAQAEITESGEIAQFIPSPFNRADFVTVAGRGGEITEVVEAAKVIESRSIVATETTESDIRMWLSAAVRDQIDGWAWVLDHDTEYVYYEANEDPTSFQERTYRRSYTLDGSTITLGDDPVEVHRRTEYDPVSPVAPSPDPAQVSSPAPAGISETDSKETAMVEIDQAEYDALQEKARRADELATELQALKETQAAQAAESRKEKALAVVEAAFGDDAPQFYVTAAETAAQSEDYDHDAFKAMVDEAAGHQASEAGTPNLGASGTTAVTESAVTKEDIVNVLEGK
jgi:hypothetical protein